MFRSYSQLHHTPKGQKENTEKTLKIHGEKISALPWREGGGGVFSEALQIGGQVDFFCGDLEFFADAVAM